MQNEILEFLYDNYQNDKISLNSFLLSLLPKGTTDQTLIGDTIRKISNSRLAEFSGEIHYLGSGSYLIPNITIEGKILAEGIKEVLAYKRLKELDTLTKEQAKQNKKTAKSTRKTNKIQKISLIATGIILLVGCIFQAISIYFSIRQLEESKLQREQAKQFRQADSLTLDGLMEKMNAIQKQTDGTQKKVDSLIKSVQKK
jgi:hypothetical protein